MDKLRKMVTAIFLNDGFLRALPLLTLIVGLALFILAYVVVPAQDYPTWHDAAKSLGQAVLVSGLVGLLTYSFKFIGIFREAVHEVMFSTEHLSSRKDLHELWSKVTSAICQEKFPQLGERLRADVLAKYVPAEKDFYYSHYSRECSIGVDGDDPDTITLHEELDFRLHPADPLKEVVYTYRSTSDSRTPADVARLSLHRLDIDGEDHQVGMTEKEYVDEFGKKGLQQSYAITLKGKESYRIRRTMTRRLCISTDPVIEFSSDEFILGCTAKFRSMEPTLVPVFQSVGTGDFDDQSMGPEGIWSVHREFEGLMFPDQGYILFIQRRVLPADRP